MDPLHFYHSCISVIVSAFNKGENDKVKKEAMPVTMVNYLVISSNQKKRDVGLSVVAVTCLVM